jgi:hypothetical protein
MPRWTEIEEKAAEDGTELPTYRIWDAWTRTGRLHADHKRGPGGKYRDWPAGEVEVGVLAGRLRAAGMTEDLAFQVARTKPDDTGQRRLILDGGTKPMITVEVQGLQ